MRTFNRFLTSRRFLATARWVDRRSPWMLWPSVWVLPDLEPTLGVRLTRWTLGWGQARFQLDWGVSDRRDPALGVDWSTSGLDGFLVWGRRVFGKQWGRADLERLFQAHPPWRTVVALGGGRAHYVRLLLARELMASPSAKARADGSGLSALEAALDLQAPDSLAEPTWSISKSAIDPASPDTVLGHKRSSD